MAHEYIVLTDPDVPDQPVIVRLDVITAVYPIQIHGKPEPAPEGEEPDKVVLPHDHGESRLLTGILLQSGNAIFVKETSGEVADRLTQALAPDQRKDVS